MDTKKKKYGAMKGVGVLTDEGYVAVKDYMLDLRGVGEHLERPDTLDAKGLLIVNAYGDFSPEDTKVLRSAICQAVLDINEEKLSKNDAHFYCMLDDVKRCVDFFFLLFLVWIVISAGFFAYLIWR